MGLFQWFMGSVSNDDLDLTEKDNNTKVQAKVGQLVKIVLEWKPSAGYCWQQADCTAGTLEAVNHQGSDKPKPGSPAHVEFVFRVTGSGYLQLTYSRPWGETEPPAKWFRVDVAVA